MKKMLYLFLLFTIIFAIGCSNNKKLVISQNCASFDFTSNEYYSGIIHSYDELKNKCEEFDNHYLDKDYVYDDSCPPSFDYECDIDQARTNVALKLQEYDESFFEKKDLIVYELQGNPFVYNRYEVSSIKYKENNVYLTLKEREKIGVRIDVWSNAKHLIVIEIDKRDSYGNENLEVVIKKGWRYID